MLFNPQVAGLGGTLGLFLGFSLMTIWDGAQFLCSASKPCCSPIKLHYLTPAPPAPPAVTNPSHAVEMEAQPTVASTTTSTSSTQPTSSVRELEASVAKLYAIVNAQAAALSDKNSINSH